jgi:hypothetical protein
VSRSNKPLKTRVDAVFRIPAFKKSSESEAAHNYSPRKVLASHKLTGA